MRLVTAAAAVAFVVSSAALALADTLITADGTVHSCEIVSVAEDGVVAKGKLKTGEAVELKIPAARLDANWFYDRRDAAIGDDAKARVRFAVWCVENDLFSRAKVQVKKAAAADPKLIEELAAGKYAEIREKIAGRILASAEADIAAGKLEPAREKVEILLGRLSDTDAGAKACETLRTLDGKQTAADAAGEAAAQAKLDDAARKADAERTKLLAAVDEDYAKGKELAMDGLTEDNHGKALDLLEKALNRGEAAMKKLDAIEKDHAADADFMTAAKARRAKTLAGMVKIRIHRADLYIWRGSLPNAKKEIDAARALDPNDPSIDSAMERLLAADDDDDFDRRVHPEQRQNGSRFGGRGGGGRGR
jgi:tetratricopeptide (TPR) repeat protein